MRAVNRTPGLIAALAVAIAALVAALPARADVASLLTAVQPQHMSLSRLARQFEREEVGTVYFDFDRDALDAAARARLDEQARFILAHAGIRFSVTGHTDKVGNAAYNLSLGLRRANRVVDYLVARGVARSRLTAMVSFGEEQPVRDVETRERLNRRVLTRVIAPSAPMMAVPQIFQPSGNARAASRVSAGAPSDPPSGAASSSSPEPSADPGTAPSGDASTSKSRSKVNSGRGNGDEVNGDPAGATKNRGGDE